MVFVDDINEQDQNEDRPTSERTTVSESEIPYTKKDECINTVSCLGSFFEICADKICDGIRDCPQGDDELGCFTPKPEGKNHKYFSFISLLTN